jgi:type II secretory pathway component PulM
MTTIDLSRAVDKIQDEIKLITATLKDKGANRFGRTLFIALAVPYGAYYLLYTPAQKRLSQVDGELQVARSTAKHADNYKDLKSQLDTTYAQLPLTKDRANFLSDAVKEALRAEGIVPTSFNPPVEAELQGGTVQNLGIMMRVKFPELMAFLSRMETSKPMIHVNAVDIAKRSSPIGVNEVNCGLSTIIMAQRF